ncbi:MAG TPA: SDR family NAD(P)-dependent oxidoreductase [Myxococcota bacterium]|nr:SDR family NAD(P)-dependent oxidoreductase [Myxococcota bacterium]
MGELRLDGRVAVVTGGGTGIGRAHARLLASRGARVVVNDLGTARDGRGGDASVAQSVVDEIERAGGKAVANADSVATVAGGESIVACALEHFGAIDILINNAGILRDRTFANLSPDDLESVLAVHLKGAFHTTQPAYREMKRRGYGRIVFTTSASGLFGNFGQANYAAAKMGLVGLTKVLAIEGAKYGIRANAIAPTARTRMTEGLLGDLAERLGPEQASAMVAYLASEECTVSGHVFSVGGGRVASVFVGQTIGWFVEGERTCTAEDVRDHLREILDRNDHLVPESAANELEQIARSEAGPQHLAR